MPITTSKPIKKMIRMIQPITLSIAVSFLHIQAE